MDVIVHTLDPFSHILFFTTVSFIIPTSKQHSHLNKFSLSTDQRKKPKGMIFASFSHILTSQFFSTEYIKVISCECSMNNGKMLSLCYHHINFSAVSKASKLSF